MNKQSLFLQNYDVARRYWEMLPAEHCEWFGVAPFGDNGKAELYYRHYEELRNLTRLVTFNGGKTVLELGSGAGRWILSLAPLVKSYTAVDLSSTMLETARRRVKKSNISNVIFEQSALQEFVPSEMYDIIYLSGVSQYLYDEDLKVVLRRLGLTLKPAGVLVDRSTTHRLARVVSEGDTYFSIYRTAKEITQLFAEEGFFNYSRKRSYRFLELPHFLRRWVSTRTFGEIVKTTAPISFHCLRLTAWAAGRLFDCENQTAELSHDFSLFQRQGKGE